MAGPGDLPGPAVLFQKEDVAPGGFPVLAIFFLIRALTIPVRKIPVIFNGKIPKIGEFFYVPSRKF